MAWGTTIDGYHLNNDGEWVPDDDGNNDFNEDDESDDGIKACTQEEADKYINSYLRGHCIGRKIYFPDEISGLPQKIIYQSSGYMYDYELKENPNPAFNGMDVTVDDITLPDGRVISDKTYSYQLVYTNEPQEPKVDEDIVFVAPEGGGMEGAEISAEEKAAAAEAEANKVKEFIDGGSKAYTGGRTQAELDDLARDPSHAGRIEEQGIKERDVGLALEQRGDLGNIVRDMQTDKGAEFIDTTTGLKWDVKSFESYPMGANGIPITKVKNGAFRIDKAMAKICGEFDKGNNVIIDARELIPEHIEQLKEAINEAGIKDRIIWYP